jgi:hypothetical protein
MFPQFKKNLIIVILDENYQNNLMFKKSSRFYDLCIINTSSRKIKINSKFYFEFEPDKKFKLVHNILNKIDFKRYNFVWIPDQDVFITESSLIEFFKIVSKYKFDLAQPSVRKNAEFNFLETKDEFIFRIVNFIDMRAPIFSLDSFIKLFDYFIKDDVVGLDWLLPKVLGYDRVAIVDAVQVVYKNKIENYLEEKVDIKKLENIFIEHGLQPFFVQFHTFLKEKIIKNCSFSIKQKNRYKFKRPSRKDNNCCGRLKFFLSNRMMKIP